MWIPFALKLPSHEPHRQYTEFKLPNEADGMQRKQKPVAANAIIIATSGMTMEEAAQFGQR